MKVFISWSGDRSRAAAEVLRHWFPSVLQAVRPYFSPDDVAKGSRWAAEIAKELDTSSVGLLVVTPENQEAPWLLFEAGALGKSLERSRVCPLLFGGMEPTDVKGPLVQFQAAQFSVDEMKRVVKMMNGELAEAALPPDVLQGVFDMWWPKLQGEIEVAMESGTESDGEGRRSERDLLEEVVALTRSMAHSRDRSLLDVRHPVWDDLFTNVADLARLCRSFAPDDRSADSIRRLIRPVEYLARSEMGSPAARRLLMELEAERVFESRLKPQPEGGIDETLASAFSQIREQVAESEARAVDEAQEAIAPAAGQKRRATARRRP